MNEKTGSAELAAIPAAGDVMIPNANVLDLIAENLGGNAITTMDLDRIKIPAGGGLSFEVPTLDGDESMKALEGVIIHQQDQNAFWPDPDAAVGVPPACIAANAKYGIGTPGGYCAECPMNCFGTDVKGGKGKACKNVKVLFLLRPGAMLPSAIFLPPTSVKTARQYFLRLTSAGIPFYSVKTRLTLEKAQSADGKPYSKIHLATVRVNEGAATTAQAVMLSRDAVDGLKAYRDAIVPMLSAVTVDAGDVDANGAE